MKTQAQEITKNGNDSIIAFTILALILITLFLNIFLVFSVS